MFIIIYHVNFDIIFCRNIIIISPVDQITVAQYYFIPENYLFVFSTLLKPFGFTIGARVYYSTETRVFIVFRKYRRVSFSRRVFTLENFMQILVCRGGDLCAWLYIIILTCWPDAQTRSTLLRCTHCHSANPLVLKKDFLFFNTYNIIIIIIAVIYT